MNLQEIEERVAEVDIDQGFDFIYDLLRAYGKPKAAITRLQKGDYNRSDNEGELLWKGQVYYRLVDAGDGDLHSLIDDAKTEERIARERPRFLIVRDSDHLLAVDTRTEATLDISMAELTGHTAFFMPWAGIEKTQLESTNHADIKAAEKMAKLYDEITKHNEISTDSAVHELNIFFSRLLFCFFAEDTGVFPIGIFTNAIGSLTKANGEDLDSFLDGLFKVLNTDHEARSGVPSHFRDFGYVNGNLFAERASSPRFTTKARNIVLECGTLDWSQINPDIFGSIMQAVVHPSQREGLGMHYTSVENIMKVIRPLFLDSLNEAFDEAFSSEKKLKNLLDRICAIQIFDPACGSGNFLVIAFKELRKLEHRILQRIAELDPKGRGLGLFKLSGIKLENFYGIEIDDFAHEIAVLSLWLAKHQMNVEFKELFGEDIPLIPLKDGGHIVCDNATRIEWSTICKTAGDIETYVLSNPPYLGSSIQNADQKSDFAGYFGTKTYPKNLDYISLWFLKGAAYICEGKSNLAFVSTNSVCQGEQVGLLWPLILQRNVEIHFAYEPFPWSNQARGTAGVTCVIVGLSAEAKDKYIFSKQQKRQVTNINPYLVGSNRNTIVHPARSSIFGLPPMVFGSKATDGGYLNLTRSEKDALRKANEGAGKFIKPYIGADEFIKGRERYCLWISDTEASQARAMPALMDRLSGVQGFRRASNKKATNKLAAVPYRFAEVRHKDSPAVLVPRHSSERREYIPMGFLDKNTVISDAANAIYDAEPWIFGLIQSRMHMVWVRAVAGRLKTDYRYSAVLVYNTFPVPELTAAHKKDLTKHAFQALGAREQFPDQTLAQLYDPDKMPNALRRTHEQLDECVDRLYRKREFESDEERLEMLFDMYETATTEGELTIDA